MHTVGISRPPKAAPGRPSQARDRWRRWLWLAEVKRGRGHAADRPSESRLCRESGRTVSHALDQRPGPEPAAAAHRHEPDLGVGALQLV